ncbi:MAG: hypothetical protein WC966_09400 [Bradymonadales bacterium]
MMPTDKRKSDRPEIVAQSSVSTLRRVVDVSTIGIGKAQKRSKTLGRKQRREKSKNVEAKKTETLNPVPAEEQSVAVAKVSRSRRKRKSIDTATSKATFKAKEFKARVSTRKEIVALDSSLRARTWTANYFLEQFASLNRYYAVRMLRGLPIFQADLFDDFELKRSAVSAIVKGVWAEIKFKALTENQWNTIIDLLSDRAIFSTSILNGELPEGIGEVFKQAGLSLFPQKYKEVALSCECAHFKMPCEHIAALVRKVADCIDENPLNIFLLRGKEEGELLDSLRDARSEQNLDNERQQRRQYELPIPSIDFSRFFEANDDLSEYNFHITRSSTNTILKRLATPSVWGIAPSPSTYIHPICEFAAQNFVKEGLRELSFEDDADASTLEGMDGEQGGAEQKQAAQKAESTAQQRSVYEDRRKQKHELDKKDKIDQDFQSTVPAELLEQFPDAQERLSAILWALKTHGAATQRQLARRTRMKKGNVAVLLEFLGDLEMVDHEGIGERARYSHCLLRDSSIDKK